MSIKPDEEAPYPDPNETADHLTDRIDMGEFGTILHIREWQGQDNAVEQFALMLNVTAAHASYRRCKARKGNHKNFDQVRRTDTWHGTVHSHQFYIDCDDEDREVHETLSGGNEEGKSRRIVNAMYEKHYNEMLYNPYEYLDRWEAGKP